ncbi:hypothetical protein ASPZODRAFT_150416 [Penicilliopsis zonata CBS 506.65]|uniref:Zn(2)-C6 fungal-type domain-containing protein n=1 Tax=Penicilliopsis zonata CBS 506.65 TaxID=1073090 RepID=A0A1L9SLU7_9EURO|nr:hypothetical protein ASPZODRAFT_150416 [Penicilliopsis zonata CBS 506.65]OJJ48113.1 hypothetical protein ASPZODRAFT_150416 [Penicilliopsis zonata CBS 506.65]
MALRRPHRKSRHGCAECKRRRVKCDEVRPSCSNCSKRDAQCEYSAAASLLWANEPSSTSSQPPSTARLETPDEPESRHGVQNRDSSFLGSLGAEDGAVSSPPDLNLTDLELMMQWVTATFHVMSRNERTDPVWRTVVPQEALGYPFLMHGILALSALHLARTKSDQLRPGYMSTAIAHQNHALSLFRGLLNDINSSNAKAIFSFSTIVLVYSFGFSHTSDTRDPWNTLADIHQVLILAHGLRQVLQESRGALQDSTFNPLMQLEPEEFTLPEDARVALGHLHEANNSLGSYGGNHQTMMYSKALGAIGNALGEVSAGLSSINVACKLAIRLPRKYVESVGERQPLALAIMACYCVVLHRLRYNWCIDDWGIRLARAIWLALDDEWRPLTNWAMMDIFGPDFANALQA